MPIVVGSTDWAVLRSVPNHTNLYEVEARFTSESVAWLWGHDHLHTLCKDEELYIAPCAGGEYFDLRIIV